MKKKKTCWQDVVLMVGGFVFAPSLVASIIEGAHYPLLTSIPTAIVLTAFVVVYLSLKYYLAAFSTSLTAFCWFWLAIMVL